MIPRDKLLELYETTLKEISTADVWSEFLKTACFNYKYDFDDQVLIFAQKPDATVLLSKEHWGNKYDRNVMPGQTGVSLFGLPEDTEQVKIVYDITDTKTEKNSVNVPIFEFNKEYQDSVVKALSPGYNVNDMDIASAVYSSAVSLANEKLDYVFPEFLKSVQGTPARNYSEPLLRIKAETLIAESAAYMCLFRCGLTTIETKFRDVSSYDSNTIVTIGTVMSSVATEIMKTIIRATLKTTNKSHQNERQTVAIEEQKSNNKIVVKNNVQDEGMGQHGNELFRPQEAAISQGEQTNTLYTVENNRSTGVPSSGNSETGSKPVGDGNQQQPKDLGAFGRTQGERFDKMDGFDDQFKGDHAGTSSERDGLQLKLNKSRKAAELKNTLPLFLSQEQLDNLLIKGSYVSNGKFRIFEQFQKKETIQKNVAFLKEEYGIGGSYGPNEIRVAYDGKGITLSDSNFKNEYLLTWNAVAKRIEQLIAANRYLTPSEIKAYPDYRAEKAAREQRAAIAEDFKNLVNDFNEIAENRINQYILNIECMNVFVIGRNDITLQKNRNGDNIYTLIYEALGQIKTVPEFIKRAGALEEAFQPYRTDIQSEFKQPPKLEYQYNYQTGDTVYIGTKEFEIAAVTPDILLSDVSFPLYQQHYTEDDFKEKLTENPLNDYLKEVVTNKLIMETQSEETADNIELSIGFSEHPVFYNAVLKNRLKGMSFALGNRLIGILDAKQQRERDDESNKVGWYHKTNFVIKAVISGKKFNFDGRFDIGDGEGDLIAHIKNFYDYALSSEGEQLYGADRKNMLRGRDEFIPFLSQYTELTLEDKSILAEIMATENEWFKPAKKETQRLTAYPVGNFYQLYGEEAEKTAELLDLHLTTHKGEPMTGFPKHSVQWYSDKLSEMGYSLEISEDNPYLTPKTQSKNEEAATPALSPDIHNYRITNPKLGVGTPGERFRYNIAAIRTLKTIESENRSATSDEQKIMSQYVGWGGLADCFDEMHTGYQELKSLLTEAEYEAARASTLTAFYTPPVVIEYIYKALAKMGFQTGNLLDPACGTGHFIGMLPEEMKKSKVYGVEIDSLSGRIAKQLYPSASIAVEGFEKTTLPDSFFDVMVGNVPFGDFKVYDEKYNQYKFLIHDYFFAKALDKVRPGGVIAFITSKGTLDKANPSVRKYIAQRAELIGAIRLPDNTFQGAAGTKVTSDIIFLQKRDRAIEIEPEWLYLDTDNNSITMNRYFIDHPEMVLGNMVMENSRFGNDSVCKADETFSLAEQLEKAIIHLNAKVVEKEIEEPKQEAPSSIPADPDVRPFSYTIIDGYIYFRENSVMELCNLQQKAKERIKGMIAIRDSVRRLLDYQTNDYPEADIKAEQVKLNELYDQFVKEYGVLTSRANKSAFRDDSSAPLLYALEILDDEGKFKRKADIFTKRTINASKKITHADTAADALAASISEKACVDLGYMAQLMGGSDHIEEIVLNLKGVIFKDPVTGPFDFNDNWSEGWQPADEYLSGNIREKLRFAQEAAIKHPEFKENVESLKKVFPKDLTAAEISVRLGSTWVSEEIYNQFIYELLETPVYMRKSIEAKYIKQTGEWKLSNRTFDKGNIKAFSSYGTKRANAYRIIEDTLNLRDVRIYDTQFDDDGKEKTVLNAKETAIAQGKQELIKQAFASWIWKDPQRRRELCKLYNETFNSTRPREYNGQHIVYHGMNPQITMRGHQNDAVAHMLYGDNVLLAHVVGAGKTFEMAAGAMEAKYLGLCQKSIFVVPNHLVEQWASEFLLLYPNANLLVTRKEDFQKENRKRFCSKIATGEFDAIIIGQSQFEKIPMSIERQEKMIRRQIADLVAGIDSASKETGQHFSVKAMERSKRALEDRLKRLSEQSKKDDVLNFEQLGVDKMFIDEAHYYKNLFLVTKMRNVAGIGQSEAQKSTDLFMKCQYLDEKTGGKGIVFATGTPISNSMVELYTMQRYLQYDTLMDLGLEFFDDWASTFGETVTAMELAPEGTGYRFKTRFAKFNNLPEIMSVFKEVADIKTADMLNLNVPKANYHNVIIPPTDFQKEYINGLAERAEAIHNRLVQPYEDNMLKVTNEGRKLALDQRLINPKASPGGESKVSACADNVYKIWRETENNRSAQMVFCDLSTPNSKEFNVYDELKQCLIKKGVPEEEIAFIHSAKSDLQKKNLFAKVRRGSVRVLIGSTQKMGAGTNVQERLAALHHLDCPWRPSDLEQREGRIIRQGNTNEEVDIYRYVTEATFDSYMWQLVENKQKFIAQIMTSNTPVRSAEDVDETSLSYGEVKALASGNPMIIEKCQIEAEVNKLNLQKASFLNDKYELEDKITQFYPSEIKKMEERIKKLAVDIQCAEEHPAPEEGISPMVLNGETFIEKALAGEAIIEACEQMRKGTTRPLGTYRGFQLSLSYNDDKFYLDLKNKLTHVVILGVDALGNIRRIDNVISNLPNNLHADKEALIELKRQFKTAKEEVKCDFSKEQELARKTEKLAKVNALLTAGQSPDRDSKEMIR